MPVLDSGARGSTTTFVQRGIGDVLIAWENEALLATEKLGQNQFEIVVPSVSILAEPPVTLVDKVVDRRGTRKVAQAYLEFLYSPEGQEIAAKHHYRPRQAEVLAKYSAKFPKITLFTIDEAFGGWTQGAADALRRWRDLRQDLRAGIVGDELMAVRVLPGFRPALGFTLVYLSLLVLIPLSGVFIKSAGLVVGPVSGTPSRVRARWPRTG